MSQLLDKTTQDAVLTYHPQYDNGFCGLFSAYRVPGFILSGFKRSHVDIHLDFEVSFEIIWYSPQVPASAASAILECAGGKNSTGLIDNSQNRRRLPSAVLLDTNDIFFSRLPLYDKTDGNVTPSYLNVGLD